MTPPELLCRIEDCDVLDRESCRQFRELRTHLHDMLVGDDDHSVSRQITSLLWRDYTWCQLNECRIKLDAAGKTLNDGLLQLLDQGFIANQALAIRRLVERKATRENRSVYSLYTSIDTLIESDHLLTRENVICYNGAKFDGSGSTCLDQLSSHAHRAFDSMCDAPTGGRFDRLSTVKMKQFGSHLSACDKMVEMANKVIAHASAPTNRGGVSGFSLDDLDRAYAAIIKVAQAISTRALFGPNVQFFPWINYDQRHGLNVPFMNDLADQEILDWSEARQQLYGQWGDAVL